MLLISVSKSAQTAQQSFLPPLPQQNNKNSTEQFQSSVINENHHSHINSMSGTNKVESISKQQKQVGTQITSFNRNNDGLEYERDHSFIIIPKSSKRKHHHHHYYHEKSIASQIAFSYPNFFSLMS